MQGLAHDLRFAVRLLLRDRTFTATALLTLALCIASNTAMFGILRSVVLKPLPFAGSSRIVLLYNSYPNAGALRAGASVPDLFDRLASVPALDEQALFRHESMTFGDENGAERLASLRATPSFYRLVRVQPLYGRLFRDDEGERGRAMKVLLGYAFWQRKFGGDAAVVGRTIRLNGYPFDVVGVLPRDFSFLSNTTDLYVPAPIGPADRSDDARHTNNWEMIGRLRDGASAAQAQAQVDAVNAANADRFPQFRRLLKDAGFRTVVVPLQEDVVRDVRAVLVLLWAGVLFVLLIGCVNVANLVLVRAAARTREMATRYAIGGGGARLARQIFTETTLLSAAGGGLGLLLGWWLLKSVAALDFDKLPRGYEVGLDAATVAVAGALTLAAGIALGAGPALAVRRLNLNAELQSEGRASTSNRGARRARRVMAAAQVALAFALVAGAGLLLASFRAVLRMDLGFQPDHVVTGAVMLPATSYPHGSDLVAFERRALAELRGRPDVVSAAVVSAVPFSGADTNEVIAAEGHVMQPGESLLAPSQVIASAGYFETMKIPIVRGRAIDRRDDDRAPAAVVVDERLAARFWGTRDPVGRRMYFPDDPSQPSRVTPSTQMLTVIGVAANVRDADPRAGFTPVGTMYFPYEQLTARAMTMTVRTRASPATALGAMRQIVTAIDPQVPLYRPRPMQEWIDRALASRRVPMLIASAFGALALLLASVGIYGVLAFTVTERRREMGVRLALGSTAGGVFRLVLFDGMRMLTAGLAIGLLASAFVGRLLRAHLFGVETADPGVIGGAAALLAAIAIAAIAVPAWRASRIDPAATLNG